MKQKKLILKDSRPQVGFTIIELMAVIAIMILLSSVIVLDFNRQKSTRAIILAKNETVTNLRKVQNYMLSSRNLPNGKAVKFYVVEFTPNSPYYTVNAIDTDYEYSEVERIYFPTGVQVASLTTSTASDTTFTRNSGSAGRSSGSTNDGFGGSSFDSQTNSGFDDVRVFPTGEDTTVTAEDDTSIQPTTYKCIQVIFSAPFGTMYTRRVIEPGSCGDTIVDIVTNPVDLVKLQQSVTNVNFQGTPGVTGAKYIQISPVTGQITAF